MTTALAPGTFLFNSIRNIGAGGLGCVDEIEVVQTACRYVVGQRLARKRLNDKWKNEPTAQARFEREIKAVQVMSHPAIVPYRGENLDGSPERFYFMQIYKGSLRPHLAGQPGGFPLAQVAAFGASIADALAHAHANRFIHRDLKPENILLTDDNAPVIGDWGLGYFVHQHSVVLQHLTRGGMGTEFYCSLEQWTTGKCDQRGDVYSLGVVLAELALGHQPPMQVAWGIRQDILYPTTKGAVRFNALVQQMTRVLPNERPANMGLVASELRYIAAIM